jgi:xanthine/CO dehydrogenase XdhC/CoxF family maturation factor
MADVDDVLPQAAEWAAKGKPVALATVIGTWGSSPRPVGSQLAIDNNGAFVGSVSGGCIEGAVIGEALETIKDGKVRILDFGVSDEQAWDVGLACGGNIKIFVEQAADKQTLARLLETRPLAQVTDLASGAFALVTPDTVEGPLKLSDAVVAKARETIRDDVSRTVEEGEAKLFIHVFNTPLRMFVVGAVHIAQALVPMAQLAGYEVSVVDPRGAFATEARFPGVKLSEDWTDDALKSFKPDARTAIVTLTHDPKLDDPALIEALRSDAFYVGALGSSRTHAKRVARLKEAGITDAQIARIGSPVGLDIGAKSPAEIAISILAEVVAAKHGKAKVK